MNEATHNLPFDERWFSTALKSIGDAVIATDDRGRVLFMNPVAEALTGWTNEEAHGKGLAEVFCIINELTRNPVDNPVEKVLATGHIIGLANRTVLIARDGKELPIDDSAAPIHDAQGRVAGVILVFRDATKKRHAELLNERLAAIVESSDDIIASKDLNGVITSWNKGAERVLGYTAEEVIGKHVSMLMPPELVEDMPRILERVRRGEKVDHYQTKRRRKDGTIIDVSLTVSPIRDADGEIIGASKIGRDITQEKLIEAERQEAERRKDEFLAMLAHELRNPLSAINGAAQLLGNLETEEELEWAKEVVLRQVKHLARLIDDLLDVSRISRGKISLRKEPLDLSPVVGSAVEAVRPLMEERKHELSVSLVNGGLRLEADPLRLEQILINLLTNAAKYTDAEGKISLTARHEGADIVITVRDTGMGISPELLPRIFDPFIQGDRTMARSEGGLGIGLTLAQKLAEMHGGGVTATSEGPGKGSEFTVRLPTLEETAARKG
jgi:PAS domain S-box-containing protein